MKRGLFWLFWLILLLVWGNAYADDLELKLFGEIHAVAKQQDSYISSLDPPSGRADVREGASRREFQNFRNNGFIGLHASGDNFSGEFSALKKWNALLLLDFDANDPDDGNDGGSLVDVSMAFVRYSPHPAIGVTIGKQAVWATGNLVHAFIAGDYRDEDFVFAQASFVNEPGINFDMHLSKEIGFGYGYFNEIPETISFLMEAEPTGKTNVLWFEYKGDKFHFNIASQFASSTSLEDENQYEYEFDASDFAHSTAADSGLTGNSDDYAVESDIDERNDDAEGRVYNFSVDYDFGIVQPFYQFLMFEGESPSVRRRIEPDVEDVRFSQVKLHTLGLVVKYDEYKFAMDHSMFDQDTDAEKYFARNYPDAAGNTTTSNRHSRMVMVTGDLISATRVELMREFKNKSRIALFYYTLKSGADDEFKHQADLLRKSPGDFLAEDSATFSKRQVIAISDWTDTTSMGISFIMPFEKLF